MTGARTRRPAAAPGAAGPRRRTALGALALGALAAPLLSGCSGPRRPAPASPFLGGLLAQGGLDPDGPEAARILGALDDAVAAAARRAGGDRAGALAAALFEDLGFERDVEDRSARATLLPAVIAARRGGCVGLATLYLAAAERWGLPAHGVLVPGHLFVRAAGPKGQLRGVELLRRGEAMPEAWYRARYGLPAAGPPPRAYLRALTADEVLAVVRFNLANELREAGALRRAAASYARAAASFPDFAEAHASLGLSLQLLGEAEAAAAAYDGAMRVHPGLPGLAENVAALARSRPAAAAPPAR